MANYSNAERRFERICNKLNQLRTEADREAYYYRKEEGVNDAFNELSDTINDAVSSSRKALRQIQSLQGAYTCPCMQKKKTVKKVTVKKVRK